MLKLNFNIFIVFLALLGLQIANIFFIISDKLYNKGSFLIFFLYILFTIIYLIKNNTLRIDKYLKVILIIFSIVPMISLLYYIFNYNLLKNIYFQEYSIKVLVHTISKTFFIVTIIFFISKLNKEDIQKTFKYYVISFIFLVLLSLSFYYILGIHKSKFIMYHPMRFGAFHYELLYFVFSALIVTIYFIKKFNFFAILLLLISSYIILIATQSNIMAIYLALIFLLLMIYKNKLFRKLYSIFLILYGIIFIVIIYIFAENIDILKALSFIFPRAGFEISGDDWSSNSLLTRVSIHYTAFEYFFSHLINIPPGIAGGLYMKEYINPFVELKQTDGTGLSIFLVDYGFYSLILLSLILYKIRDLATYVNKNNIKYFLIFNMAIFTITFHAGYLNYSVWTWLILSYRYIYLTRGYK